MQENPRFKNKRRKTPERLGQQVRLNSNPAPSTYQFRQQNLSATDGGGGY